MLVDLEGERYFSLNGTGAVIWEELSQGRSASDAAARIVADFSVDVETARADATELAQALVEAGLLISED